MVRSQNSYLESAKLPHMIMVVVLVSNIRQVLLMLLFRLKYLQISPRLWSYLRALPSLWTQRACSLVLHPAILHHPFLGAEGEVPWTTALDLPSTRSWWLRAGWRTRNPSWRSAEWGKMMRCSIHVVQTTLSAQTEPASTWLWIVCAVDISLVLCTWGWERGCHS